MFWHPGFAIHSFDFGVNMAVGCLPNSNQFEKTTRRRLHIGGRIVGVLKALIEKRMVQFSTEES